MQDVYLYHISCLIKDRIILKHGRSGYKKNVMYVSCCIALPVSAYFHLLSLCYQIEIDVHHIIHEL
jgi:hypothetical protein